MSPLTELATKKGNTGQQRFYICSTERAGAPMMRTFLHTKYAFLKTDNQAPCLCSNVNFQFLIEFKKNIEFLKIPD